MISVVLMLSRTCFSSPYSSQDCQEVRFIYASLILLLTFGIKVYFYPFKVFSVNWKSIETVFPNQ